ncbi:MAG: hypothetical protein ACJ752_08205 [Gaiellaceae bacterium]
MELVVSQEAADYIGERGGRLYLWQEPVGKSWAADHIAFVDPSRGIPFTVVWIGGVAVMLAEDLEPPQSLRLRLRLDHFPRRLHVEWDGARWGWRGGAEGGGG